jgi:hypothetical protein
MVCAMMCVAGGALSGMRGGWRTGVRRVRSVRVVPSWLRTVLCARVRTVMCAQW